MAIVINFLDITWALVIPYSFIPTIERANMSLYIDNSDSVLVKVHINEENGVVKNFQQFFKDGSLRVFTYDKGNITNVVTYRRVHVNGHFPLARQLEEE